MARVASPDLVELIFLLLLKRAKINSCRLAGVRDVSRCKLIICRLIESCSGLESCICCCCCSASTDIVCEFVLQKQIEKIIHFLKQKCEMVLGSQMQENATNLSYFIQQK